MAVDMAALAADLAAESAVTRALVAGLDETGWHLATPAAGWDIADQITHLACVPHSFFAIWARPLRPRTEPVARDRTSKDWPMWLVNSSNTSTSAT